jgi:toxin ParE1/3/4
MFRYRLSEAAQGDVLDILAWTDEQFGEAARLRYESLIVAALRDVARHLDPETAWD